MGPGYWGAVSKIPTYRAVLAANDSFRRVWLGEVVSFLGDWFSLIALYTVVQTLTDSATAVAGVLVGKTLPIFLVTPFAGPLVDRVDRRLILLATEPTLSDDVHRYLWEGPLVTEGVSPYAFAIDDPAGEAREIVGASARDGAATIVPGEPNTGRERPPG